MDRRDVLTYCAATFVANAAFPRLAHRLRWPTRLGPRGLVGYVAFNTAVLFALRTWLLPFFKRMAEDALRQQLGREPTEDELFAHLGVPRRR
jgi:hypothetical protein